MRVPLTNRFSPSFIVGLLILIFLGQQIEGTGLLFSLLSVLYIGLWATAYNVAGGIDYPSGSYIFFFGLFTVTLGMVAKVVLGEAADKTLRSPVMTMFCYCIAMSGMLAAAFVARGLRARQPILRNFDNLEQLKQASIVSLILGVLIVIFLRSSVSDIGTASSTIRQLDHFLPVSVLFATTYQIKVSGGKSSFNWVVITSMSILVGYGLISFTKEGILAGPTAWFIAALIQRYSFPKRLIFGGAFALWFMTYYLVPYSQYVRTFQTGDRFTNYSIALRYLTHLGETRQLYLQSATATEVEAAWHLFDQNTPFLERAIMLAPDDALVQYTLQGHTFGLSPTISGYANVIPRFLWPDKPIVGFGNLYAHELGNVNEDDFSTGISFSAMADAFHQAAWAGLVLLLPINLFLLFLILDSFAGSARQAPWALLFIVETSHFASEGGVYVIIYLFTYGLASLLLLFFVTRRMAPLLLQRLAPVRQRVSRARVRGRASSSRPLPGLPPLA